MNRFNGFLSLVFVAAFGLVACKGDAAADEQKRKDDSLAAAIAHQDSLAKINAPVDTTKKAETTTATPEAKTQTGTKTTTTGTKTNEVKTNTSSTTSTTNTGTTSSNTSSTTTPTDSKNDAQKAGGNNTQDAQKAGPTDPKKVETKATKAGKQ